MTRTQTLGLYNTLVIIMSVLGLIILGDALFVVVIGVILVIFFVLSEIYIVRKLGKKL